MTRYVQLDGSNHYSLYEDCGTFWCNEDSETDNKQPSDVVLQEFHALNREQLFDIPKAREILLHLFSKSRVGSFGGDANKIQCWVSPKGEIFHVKWSLHCAFANEVCGTTEYALEQKGWAKVTNGILMFTAHRMTKRLLNALESLPIIIDPIHYE